MARTLGMIGQAANDIGDSIINYTMTKRERDDLAEQRLVEKERWDKAFQANQAAAAEERRIRLANAEADKVRAGFDYLRDVAKNKPKPKTIDDMMVEELSGMEPEERRQTLFGLKRYSNAPKADDGISDSQERLRAGDYQRAQVRRLTTKLRGQKDFSSAPGFMLEEFDRPESVISFANRNRDRLSPESAAIADSADYAYGSDPLTLQSTWGQAGVGMDQPRARTLGVGGGAVAEPAPQVVPPKNPTDVTPLPPQGFPEQKMAQWALLWQDYVEGRITETDFNDWANYYMQGGE